MPVGTKENANYLWFIRDQYGAPQIPTNPTQQVDQHGSQPARHLFNIAKNCKVENQHNDDVENASIEEEGEIQSVELIWLVLVSEGE